MKEMIFEAKQDKILLSQRRQLSNLGNSKNVRTSFKKHRQFTILEF